MFLDLVQEGRHVCETGAEAAMSGCRDLRFEGGASKMDGLSIKLGRAALLVRRLHGSCVRYGGEAKTFIATRERRGEDTSN